MLLSNRLRLLFPPFKVAPKVFQKRDSQVSISHKQSTAFPGIEDDFDWTSGRNGGTLGHHGATTLVPNIAYIYVYIILFVPSVIICIFLLKR